MWLSNNISCVFFDLDRTLWDFESNAGETLKELFYKHKLNTFISNPQEFIDRYSAHNRQLWSEYTAGNLKKEQLRQLRFYLTLKDFGLDNAELGVAIDADYIKYSPLKTTLFPYTREILEYLTTKKYKLYIITNGFTEVQRVKLRNTGIDNYFEAVFTSEEVGYQKPDRRIFTHALSVAKCTANKSIMVGDDWESDIIGAKNAGIPQIFFNPNKNPKVNIGEPTYEISYLKEIENIL